MRPANTATTHHPAARVTGRSERALLRRRHCLAAALLLALASSARAGGPAPWPELKADLRRRYPSVPQLTVPALQAWLLDASKAPPLLLDVRTAEEFADGHLAGAVRVGSKRAALQLLQARPPGAPVVLYCSVGERSSALAQALIADGVRGVQNLEGSLFEWANSGHAVVDGTGSTGRVHPYDRQWGRLLQRELWSREP